VKFTAEYNTGEALELMTSVLRPRGDIAAEYPLALGAEGPGQVVSLCEDGTILSSCAVLERELLHPEGKTRVGLIGSVVTRPDARGRGLATKLLEHAEGRLRATGCEHALLWADDPTFYSRRGYALDGYEVDFLVDRALGELPTEGFNVRPLRVGDEALLHELYLRHEARVERSLEETARLLTCPGMRVSLAEREGECVAYVCYGRGGDLAGVAHEWGGDPRGVLSCLAALLRETEAIFVMAPGNPGPLGELLDSLGAPRANGRLGMSKPLGAERSLPAEAFIWGLDSI
jgi:GNAT superfamily N-acetyltransferase